MSGFFSSLLSAGQHVVQSISTNGIKVPPASVGSVSVQPVAPPAPAPAKQPPSLPSTAVPNTPVASGLDSTLASLILKSTEPVITRIDGDLSAQVNSIEHAVIFATAAGAAGALLYENNRAAGALAGFAAGLYFGSR